MIDTDKMRFNPDRVPKGDLMIKHYPQLGEYKEFSKEEHDDLLRIAFFATDQESPFVKLEREDYEKRLVKIFEHTGIQEGKLLGEITLGANAVYESMVNRIFMLSDNLAYVMWSNKLRMFHYIGMSLRQPPDLTNMVSDMQKRSTLDASLKNIYNDLVDYEAQVFTDIPTRNKIRKQLAKLLQPAEQFAVSKQVI